MECNKEEAIRAKQLAEKKLESLDFEGARKMAQKAQSLHPSIQNISQILSICDVHCSAQKRILGTEKDWYGILQVQKLADEPTVKKQYRRLALHLHPDKNRFPGAEAAFKYIVEANAVLSDPAKKAAYDNQILEAGRPSAATVNVPPHHTNANQTYRFNRQRGFGGSVRQEMFLTSCPFCRMKYQQPRTLMNTMQTCHSCLKKFTAGPTWVPPVSSQTGGNFGLGNSVSREVSQWRASRRAARQQAEASGIVRAENDDKEKCVDGRGINESASHGTAGGSENEDEEMVSERKVSRKRRRQVVVSSSESLGSPGDSDQEEKSQTSNQELNSGVGRGQTRTAQNLTYAYTESNEEDEVDYYNNDKRPGPNEVSEIIKELHTDTLKRPRKSKGTRLLGKKISGKGADAPKTEIEDPEFNDFEKFRDVSLFKANQIWACYDSNDGMPRFHAKVKKVHRSPFELRFTWLEPNPVEDALKKWVKANLPVGCGTFKLGETAMTDVNHMFSHQVNYDKGKKRGSFVVYPKAGEVWALFKDWDLKWSSRSHPDSHRVYKYEIVEVLSDFDAVSGLKASYLEKADDFVSIFKRSSEEEADIIQVWPNEMYKLSHRIPSFKMTGSERKGVPPGSFELDTASLPLDPDDLYYHRRGEKTGHGHGANWAQTESAA